MQPDFQYIPQKKSLPSQSPFALYADEKLSEALAVAQTMINGPGKNVAVLNLAAVCHMGLRRAVSLHHAGQWEEAVCWYKKVIAIQADNVVALSNLGVALQEMGAVEEGIACSRQAILLKPDWADLHYNLGNGLEKLGKWDLAMASYQQAITLKPDFAHAHNNIGNIQKELGAYDQAVARYQQALSLQPDYAEACHNMGISYYLLGKLDQAVVSYRQALSLQPDYAEAYRNLGIALYDLDQEEEAVASYQKAIAIKPDDAEAMYNFHAILCDTDPLSAMALLEQAVKRAPDDITIRFFMNLLHDYTQDAGFLQEDVACYQAVNGLIDSWHYVKSRGKPFPILFGTTKKGLCLGMAHAHVEGLVLEFGVRHGTTIRHIAALAGQVVHGFDSFQGLPEDWHGNQAGSYSTHGILPIVPDTVSLHVGLFEESLPGFLETARGPARFIHIDCDLYRSTKTVFDWLGERIVSGTVLVFDEYFANERWREDEYKAFQEAVKKWGWSYDYIGFSLFSKQAVIIIR